MKKESKNSLIEVKNDFLKIAFFQLWPVRSRLYRLEILKVRPFGLRTRRDLTEYAKKKKSKIFRFFIEIIDDHKSAISAIGAILQKATPLAFYPLQEKQVKN